MERDPVRHAPEGSVYTSKLVLIGFLAAAAFFLWTEHRAHTLGILPYLVFLACPLMHLFHLHGHRQHRGTNNNPDKSSQAPPEEGNVS